MKDTNVGKERQRKIDTEKKITERHRKRKRETERKLDRYK